MGFLILGGFRFVSDACFGLLCLDSVLDLLVIRLGVLVDLWVVAVGCVTLEPLGVIGFRICDLVRIFGVSGILEFLTLWVA